MLSISVCLSAIVALADDVTVVSRQTQWTFDSYEGQTTKVCNYDGSGLFLHSSQTDLEYKDFCLDAVHVASTEGTFAGTTVAWAATSVLVAQKGAGSSFLSLGNVDAASEDGAETTLAFNAGAPGTLYVVYGATSEDDGYFYIRHRQDGATTFTTIYEQEMQGTRYTGPLASPRRKTASGYLFTEVEAAVAITEAGTVYMGGSLPYCIYAVLFVPETALTIDFSKIYEDDSSYELTFGEESTKVYYYKRTDDTTGQDANGNFYPITSDPVNSMISWREKNVQIGSSGLKPTKGDRPFAIHGLRSGDVVRMDFSGEIYYARHSTRGSSLDGMNPGEYLVSLQAYTVSQQDIENDYVVFYPSQSTTISRLSINQEMEPRVDPVVEVAPPVVTLVDDSRKDRKIYQVLFGRDQKLFYMRPGQDTEPRSQSFKDEFITNPLTITVNNNGVFVCWTQQTVGGKQYESDHVNTEVNTIAKRPTAALSKVENSVGVYEITFSEGTTLHYKLGDGEEQTVGTGSTITVNIETTCALVAYSKNDYVVSDTLKTTLPAPTPAPSREGYFDFDEITADMTADVAVTLDNNQSVAVGEETLYKPSALTAATFSDKFAFGTLTKSSQVRIRTSRQLLFATGENLRMAVLNMRAGDVFAVGFTGTILMDDPGMLTALNTGGAGAGTTADADQLQSDVTYVVERDGDIVLTLVLTEQTVSITKVYAAPPMEASEPVTYDFATAKEDGAELQYGRVATVYYNDKTSAQRFNILTNDDDNIPIAGRISVEGSSGTLEAFGLKVGGKRIAIHNLAKGDRIQLRHFNGEVTYEGYESRGNTVSVDGVRLAPSDVLQSGTVIVVDEVDYVNNYVVLKLNSKVNIASIMINDEEVDKVLMPTITDKGKGVVVIGAGKCLSGREVTTSYTTDGSTPSATNGTIGAYDSIEIELLWGGNVTIKAVSFTADGSYSKVATLQVYVEDRVNSIDSCRKDQDSTSPKVYNLQGQQVSDVLRGHIYIVGGRKVIIK